MKTLVSCVVLCCASSVWAQGYVPYAPGSIANPGQQVVQQQVVQQQNAAPPPYGPQLPSEWLRNGYREQFTRTETHDVFPFRDWQAEHPYGATVSPGSLQYYAPTGCWQRSVAPQQPCQWQYPCQQYQWQYPCQWRGW